MNALRRLLRNDDCEATTRRRFLGRLGLLGGLGLLPTTAWATVSDDSENRPAGLQPFIGEIIMFAGNFAPRDWALCDGQLLDIQNNQALFSILGTTYGGDGRTNFALPDLRGRTPIHVGTGPGLTQRRLGEKGGAETVTLGVAELPAHAHPLNAGTSEGAFDSPDGRYPARPASGIPQYTDTPNTTMATNAVGTTGPAGPHDNMPPFLGINYIIAITGVFPSRN